MTLAVKSSHGAVTLGTPLFISVLTGYKIYMIR